MPGQNAAVGTGSLYENEDTAGASGKMPLAMRERYVKMKEDPNHKPNLDMLIENFDRALSHPDKADLEKLQKSVLR